MGLIQTGLGIASDILGKCGEDKAKAIVDAILRCSAELARHVICEHMKTPELRLRGFSVRKTDASRVPYAVRSIEAHRKRLQPPVVRGK